MNQVRFPAAGQTGSNSEIVKVACYYNVPQYELIIRNCTTYADHRDPSRIAVPN